MQIILKALKCIDASEQGLGVVLFQDQDDGTTRVIAYASWNLSKSEKRYNSSKLEFWLLSGVSANASMNIYMVGSLRSAPIIIH